jgi:predicted RNA-binding protein with PUA-like domain
MRHWLLKSEPDSFSVEDLARAPKRTAAWDGVRNYQARNFLRDEMKKGDLAFFYYSSCAEPGIYGIVKVVRGAYPDHTAFERGHHHFDADSDPDAPRWFMVDVQLVKKLARPITLEQLKANRDRLPDLLVLRRGNRLSVTPVTATEWQRILVLQ